MQMQMQRQTKPQAQKQKQEKFKFFSFHLSTYLYQDKNPVLRRFETGIQLFFLESICSLSLYISREKGDYHCTTIFFSLQSYSRKTFKKMLRKAGVNTKRIYRNVLMPSGHPIMLLKFNKGPVYMEWGTPVQWGWFLLFSRSGGHKTKETYPTRLGPPTPCKHGLIQYDRRIGKKVYCLFWFVNQNKREIALNCKVKF